MQANTKKIHDLLHSQISVATIAADTGISESNLYKLKNGEVKIENMTMKNAARLTDYYQARQAEIQM
ncbi:hypothetical protein AWM75_02045 [Aerococcus urinaehominis]|uniref:HTH cro/C1-type domain-containing protein n=1 Tax=Aerococcus urinaehominis TaxID=128944 RepID=A0A0X8FKE4_9LACT|nr:helix-turn-helix domain-containing protein [Aerococcus urinaehominis]AMB98847.1 hypothetical protein AWM75_02045 [Aerococcus urinaehominis]SDM17415.1 Cro/C1-type HTH DNA-binding domain-containing protein [Aerococcus urinaehominis]